MPAKTMRLMCTPEQIAEASALLEYLNEQIGTDIFSILEHVLLNTDHWSTRDDEILSWFPRDFVQEAIRYMKDVKRDLDDE